MEEIVCLDTGAIQKEERYDSFYAVCANLDGMGVDEKSSGSIKNAGKLKNAS